MAGQPPAQQRLGADDRAIVQVDLRLIEDHQFVALERAPQLALEHQPLDRGGVHLRRIEREAVAAVLLGVVHRGVGVADQVDDVLGVVRAERDADAGRQEHFVLVDVERLADLGEDAAREVRDRPAVVGIARQTVDEQRELVAGEAAEHRVLRQRRASGAR